MIRLGITGGIGSGKSFVSRRLAAMGVPVYDTDSRARQLMTESAALRDSLTALVGEGVYLPDGQLDRPFLAAYLFADPTHTAAVNARVHPCVRDDFRQWCRRQTAPVVAMECAILFESGFDTEVDRVLMVSAPWELRLRRAVERDRTTEEKVRMRMAAQLADDEKCRRADYILLNDGIQEVDPQLQRFLKTLKERKE